MDNKEDIIPISDIFGVEDDIEVLEDTNNTNNENVIDINRLFEDKTDSISIKENEEKEKKQSKLIEKIQIGLIIFLIISATIFYFFGYDIVEPFIKIE